MKTIAADVARKLGWYVYAYVNPSDGKICYVGKGKGQRAVSHVRHHARVGKVKEPRVDILAHGLGSKPRPTSRAGRESIVPSGLGFPSWRFPSTACWAIAKRPFGA